MSHKICSGLLTYLHATRQWSHSNYRCKNILNVWQITGPPQLKHGSNSNSISTCSTRQSTNAAGMSSALPLAAVSFSQSLYTTLSVSLSLSYSVGVPVCVSLCAVCLSVYLLACGSLKGRNHVRKEDGANSFPPSFSSPLSPSLSLP